MTKPHPKAADPGLFRDNWAAHFLMAERDLMTTTVPRELFDIEPRAQRRLVRGLCEAAADFGVFVDGFLERRRRA